MGDLDTYYNYIYNKTNRLMENFDYQYDELRYGYENIDISSPAYDRYKTSVHEMTNLLYHMKEGDNTKDRNKVFQKFVDATDEMVKYIDEHFLTGHTSWKEKYVTLSDDELKEEEKKVSLEIQKYGHIKNTDIMKSDLPGIIGAKDDNLGNLDLTVFRSLDNKDGVNLKLETLFDFREDISNVGKASLHQFFKKVVHELNYQKEENDYEKERFKKGMSKCCGKEGKALVKARFEMEDELEGILNNIAVKQKRNEEVSPDVTKRVDELQSELKANDAKILGMINNLKDSDKNFLTDVRGRIIQRKVISEVLSRKEVGSRLEKLAEEVTERNSEAREMLFRKLDDIRGIFDARNFKERITGEFATKCRKGFEELNEDIAAYNYVKKYSKAQEGDTSEFMKVYDNAKKSVKLNEADVDANCQNAGIDNLDKALVMINRFKGKSFSDEYKEVIKSVARLTYDYKKADADPTELVRDYDRVSRAIEKYMSHATVKNPDGTVSVKNVGAMSNQASRDSKVNILNSLSTYLNKDFIKDCAEKNIDLKADMAKRDKAKAKISSHQDLFARK